MEGPNFNSALIAFFGMVTSAIAAYVAIKTNSNAAKIDTNTQETIKAKHAARSAARKTNGELDTLIREVIEKVRQEDSSTRLGRIMQHVEQHTKEQPKLPEQEST